MAWTLDKNDARSKKFLQKIASKADFLDHQPIVSYSRGLGVLNSSNIDIFSCFISKRENLPLVFSNSKTGQNYVIPVQYCEFSIFGELKKEHWAYKSKNLEENKIVMQHWPAVGIQIGDLIRWSINMVPEKSEKSEKSNKSDKSKSRKSKKSKSKETKIGNNSNLEIKEIENKVEAEIKIKTEKIEIKTKTETETKKDHEVENVLNRVKKMDSADSNLDQVEKILGFGIPSLSRPEYFSWSRRTKIGERKMPATRFNTLQEYCGLFTMFDLNNFLYKREASLGEIAKFWLYRVSDPNIASTFAQYYCKGPSSFEEEGFVTFPFGKPKSVVDLVKEMVLIDPSEANKKMLKTVTGPLNKNQTRLLQTKYAPHVFQNLEQAYDQGYHGWTMRNVSILQWSSCDTCFLPNARDTEQWHSEMFHYHTNYGQKPFTNRQACDWKYGKRRNSWNSASQAKQACLSKKHQRLDVQREVDYHYFGDEDEYDYDLVDEYDRYGRYGAKNEENEIEDQDQDQEQQDQENQDQDDENAEIKDQIQCFWKRLSQDDKDIFLGRKKLVKIETKTETENKIDKTENLRGVSLDEVPEEHAAALNARFPLDDSRSLSVTRFVLPADCYSVNGDCIGPPAKNKRDAARLRLWVAEAEKAGVVFLSTYLEDLFAYDASEEKE